LNKNKIIFFLLKDKIKKKLNNKVNKVS